MVYWGVPIIISTSIYTTIRVLQVNGDIIYSDLGRRDVDTGCFALGILINILDEKKVFQ